MSFDVFEAMKHPNDAKKCYRLDVLDKICTEQNSQISSAKHLIHALINYKAEGEDWENEKINECITRLKDGREVQHNTLQKLELA